MHLITALILPIGPDTVILVCLDVTGHLRQLKRHTHLRVLRVEGDGRVVCRASWANPVLNPTKTVLPTGPLGQGELAGLLEVGGGFDMVPVGARVEPLACVLSALDVAVDVFDVDSIGRVDWLTGLALFVLAEFEFAPALAYAIGAGVVLSVGFAAEKVAVGSTEGVAFSC